MESGNPAHEPAVSALEMQRLWDQRYAQSGEVWSGQPNASLVAEAGRLPAGRALDVGCGEGADAVWLALQGWDVTALDVSSVALRRAQAGAVSAGVVVHWLHFGILDAPLVPGSFDLVVAMYPALVRTADRGAEVAIMDSVAQGGTLLFVHHSVFGTQPAGAGHGASGHHHRPGHGPGDGPPFSPQDLVGVADMRAALLDAGGDDWLVEVHEVRPRDVDGGAGAHFTEDVVLRARRLA